MCAYVYMCWLSMSVIGCGLPWLGMCKVALRCCCYHGMMEHASEEQKFRVYNTTCMCVRSECEWCVTFVSFCFGNDSEFIVPLTGFSFRCKSLKRWHVFLCENTGLLGLLRIHRLKRNWLYGPRAERDREREREREKWVSEGFLSSIFFVNRKFDGPPRPSF